MELISTYELKKRKAYLAWVEADLRKFRPMLLAQLRAKSWRISRSDVIWGYIMRRKMVSAARERIATAKIEKAPRWSPAVRASRGWPEL